MPREPEELETYKVAKCPMPLPADYFGSIEHVVIQDDKPVDSSFAEKEQRLLTEPLYSSWRGGKRRPQAQRTASRAGRHDCCGRCDYGRPET